MSIFPVRADCEGCKADRFAIDAKKGDYVVALAGNPNTGKSTVFNALTGLRQHTGNWPGKTVARAEGTLKQGSRRFKLVDLPGTYSLLSATEDEEIARDFILFGQPDCTVVVVDATCLERNLNLVLQILEITDRVVICLNLMDEAARKGITINHKRLATDLGVPVIPTVAKSGKGLDQLIRAVGKVISGSLKTNPHRIKGSANFRRAVSELLPLLQAIFPGLPNARWVAMRLLDGDIHVEEAVRTQELAGRKGKKTARATGRLLARAEQLRKRLHNSFADEVVMTIYADAEVIAARSVSRSNEEHSLLESRLDRILTSPVTGLPIMLVGLGIIFWITIIGANYPSQMIATVLFWIESQASALFESFGAPWWLTGFLWHGVYRGIAWVVSVMLPPMAIFFPLYTILEDLGFLPRVAFNMDRLFKAAGAHGKQALTMCMGFGCNAAGVIGCRIIHSPRERLIAILTNNFVPCNGRFPTLIMVALIFVTVLFPARFSSFIAAATVLVVVLVGVVATFLVSWVLSHTLLKGEPSAFILELPPFRRPKITQILYTSLIDRTIWVLWRAIIWAAPAGGLIWLLGNISISGSTLLGWMTGALSPVGEAMGLDGVILLAFFLAIPANEILVPTILMGYLNSGMLTDVTNLAELQALFVGQYGWTLPTAICLMLFVVFHNPCATAIHTIWKETGSKKWTAVAALMPLAIGFSITVLVAQIGRMFFGF